jgi:hypothetical protein
MLYLCIERFRRLVELAIGILDTAYKFNPEMATALLNSAGHPRWSHLSVMEVAALAEAKVVFCLSKNFCKSFFYTYKAIIT